MTSLSSAALSFDDDSGQRLLAARRMTWIVAALFVVALLWAWAATLDEVATGQGRVVPTTHDQVLQSLEGGILKRMLVRQDDIVKPGQVLSFPLHDRVRVLRVEALPARRGPASEAQACYTDLAAANVSQQAYG